MSKKDAAVIEAGPTLDINSERWYIADSYGRRFLGQVPAKLHSKGESLAEVIERAGMPNVLALFPAYELNVMQSNLEDGRTMMGLQVTPLAILAVGAPFFVRWNGLGAVHEMPEVDINLLRDGIKQAEDRKTQFRAARLEGLTGAPRVSLK
jgi:hypothetical protein